MGTQRVSQSHPIQVPASPKSRRLYGNLLIQAFEIEEIDGLKAPVILGDGNDTLSLVLNLRGSNAITVGNRTVTYQPRTGGLCTAGNSDSRSYLSRSFATEKGMTIQKYVRELRLDRAMELISGIENLATLAKHLPTAGVAIPNPVCGRMPWEACRLTCGWTTVETDLHLIVRVHSKGTMKIGEIAKLTGCSVETVRYYEQQSLLPKAKRSLNGYREYDESHEKVLRFIRNCRVLNMSHAEIRTLLRSDGNPSRTCQPINDVLDEHIAHVEERIKELKELKATLTEIRRLCSKSGKSRCGIIEGLSRLKMTGDRWNKTHL